MSEEDHAELNSLWGEFEALENSLGKLRARLVEIDPTYRFIDKFCAPQESAVQVSYDELLRLYQEADASRVAQTLREIDYDLFLQTAYWKVVAAKVKEKKGNRCCGCGSTDSIDIHHCVYDNHGREIETWESDLNPFCHECHGKLHDKAGRNGLRRKRFSEIQPAKRLSLSELQDVESQSPPPPRRLPPPSGLED